MPLLDDITRLHLRSAARRILRRLRRPAPVAAPGGPPVHRRFLSGASGRQEAWLQAAREYVSRKDESGRAWLYRKPYDTNSGNPEFFHESYSVLNLLQAMSVPSGGRILEVGSGPGWITEILMSLGFEVDGIEPSEAMIEIARERVESAARHHRIASPARVVFHASTIEDCGLPDDSFDAVLFHAALHHVVDENRTLAQCFRLLCPGGVLGVCEAAWVPGKRALEEKLEEEMRLYGTLENPYTTEYLDWLLREHGFVEVRRYHAVNGYFPAEQGALPLEAVAGSLAHVHNNLTARKPSPWAVTTLDHHARTQAGIELLESRFDPATGHLHLRARLSNRGETAWLHRTPRVGRVSIALRSGEPGSPGFREAEPRHLLPRPLPAGESMDMDLEYQIPPGLEDAPWELDLINEQMFWFSHRGTKAARVPVRR